MTSIIPYGHGLIVSPVDVGKDLIVYAELEPSIPIWRRRDWYRFNNWWWEVFSQGLNPYDGTHHYEHDGGARTFRQAVKSAMLAVDAVARELQQGPQGRSYKP